MLKRTDRPTKTILMGFRSLSPNYHSAARAGPVRGKANANKVTEPPPNKDLEHQL